MSEKQTGPRNTFYYRIGALERALVELKTRLSYPQSGCPIHLTPTQIAVLLEAARIGAGEIYKNPELLMRMGVYPFP